MKINKNDNFVKTVNLNSIPNSTGRKVKIKGKWIALFKHNKKVYAIRNSCPHQGADLADGHIQDGKAVCPLHRWMFDLKTGAFSGNENIRIPTYKTKVKNNEVYVLLDD